MSEPLLRVRDLEAHFDTEHGAVRAVDGIGFDVGRGESVALVGESGCGKTATALALLGLLPGPAGRIVGGGARFDGRELVGMDDAELRALRGRRVAMIFQDPMTSLNPYLRVEEQLVEGPQRHLGLSRTRARARAVELLERVGIPDAPHRIHAYPHELSGGMRQRVMIAMALACEPDLLVADEPTTALDVTVQAQILALLAELRAERGLALLLITHDLAVVAETCQRVLVMYAGRIVEQGPIGPIFEDPRHPYTLGLLRSMPRLDERQSTELAAIPGQPPNLQALPAGCAFRERCAFAFARCLQRPDLLAFGPGRAKACHLERLP